MHRLTGAKNQNRTVFAYNPLSVFAFFSADFSGSASASHYIVIIHEHVICVEDIRHKHNKHRKKRYQEANSRWCNVTSAQIRAAFLRSLKLRARIWTRPAQA